MPPTLPPKLVKATTAEAAGPAATARVAAALDRREGGSPVGGRQNVSIQEDQNIAIATQRNLRTCCVHTEICR